MNTYPSINQLDIEVGDRDLFLKNNLFLFLQTYFIYKIVCILYIIYIIIINFDFDNILLL